MELSRREFMAGTTLLAAGLAVPGVVRAAMRQAGTERKPQLFSWDEPSQGVFVTTPRDGRITLGGNAMLVHGSEGAILIDTKFAALGRRLREECEGFGKPLAYVINSHHHMDHTGGNWAFSGKKAPKLASHPKAKVRIAEQVRKYREGVDGTFGEVAKLSGAARDEVMASVDEVKKAVGRLSVGDFTPVTAFETNELNLPGAPVQINHTGPGHTDNDLWFFFPQHNVLHTGDLLFNGLHPYIDGSADASTRGWQKALTAMMRYCNEKTIVVPGHGDITDMSALTAQSKYFETLRDAVAAARKAGKDRETVTKMLPSDIPGFDKLGFERMLPNALGVVFDELAKE